MNERFVIEFDPARCAFVVRGNLDEAKHELQRLPELVAPDKPVTIDLRYLGVEQWDEATKGLLCSMAERQNVRFEVNPKDTGLNFRLGIAGKCPESYATKMDFAHKA